MHTKVIAMNAGVHCVVELYVEHCNSKSNGWDISTSNGRRKLLRFVGQVEYDGYGACHIAPLCKLTKGGTRGVIDFEDTTDAGGYQPAGTNRECGKLR